MPMGFYGSGVTVAEISAVANDITAIPALAGCIHVQTCADTCTPNSESAIPGELLGKFTSELLGPDSISNLMYREHRSTSLPRVSLCLSLSVSLSLSFSVIIFPSLSLSIELLMYMYVCTCVRMYVYVCLCMYLEYNICVYIQYHNMRHEIHTHIYIYTYVYIHTV